MQRSVLVSAVQEIRGKLRRDSPRAAESWWIKRARWGASRARCARLRPGPGRCAMASEAIQLHSALAPPPPRAAGEALGGGEALWRPHLQSPERGAALARLEKRPRSRGHS